MRTSGTEGNHKPVSSFPDGKITMTGKDVWKFAQRIIENLLTDLCEQADIKMKEISFVIPHQGSPIMLKTAARNLGLADDVMQINGKQYGNTAAASAAIMMHECFGNIKHGEYVAVIGFGAGLSWHGILFQA